MKIKNNYSAKLRPQPSPNDSKYKAFLAKLGKIFCRCICHEVLFSIDMGKRRHMNCISEGLDILNKREDSPRCWDMSSDTVDENLGVAF